MEKVTQERKEIGLENQALENISQQQPADAEAFKVNSIGVSETDQEKIDALKSELEEIGKQEAFVERPNVHLGDNNTHLNNSVNITNTINNGGNSDSKGREVYREAQKEPKGFIEKYFGKLGKGVFKLINPLTWLRILKTKVEKK